MSQDRQDLKLKSNPSAEEFTATSPKRPKKRNTRYYEVDGLGDLEKRDFLPRASLVQKVLERTRETGLLIISSPPGTGKTSLLTLLKAKLKESKDIVTGIVLRPSNPQKEDFNLFDFVKNKTGVSYEQESLADGLKSKSEIWILFDDAQRLYNQKFDAFWEDIVKNRGNERFGKTKIRVVVAATYYLENKTDSPVAFENERRINVADLLLQKTEAAELFDLRCKYPEWGTFRDALYYLTNGNAAAFTIGMNIIFEETESVDSKSSNDGLNERSFLQEKLIQNNSYLSRLGRCFPVKGFDEESHQVIMTTLVDAYSADMGENISKQIPILKLRKAGILDEGGRFSSPAAARFYYNQVFPSAVDPDKKHPTSLDGLIEEATKKLSAHRLRHTASKSDKCPKEAVFQHLFHEAIRSLLPLSYRIIPEYGTMAVIDGVPKTGELDFYIINGKKWALELLRDGQKISQHLNRIPGNYQNVEANQWLMVDCRVEKEPQTKATNYCALVFSKDFKTAMCYMPGTEPKELKLME